MTQLGCTHEDVLDEAPLPQITKINFFRYDDNSASAFLRIPNVIT